MNTQLASAKHEHFAQFVSNGETPARAYVLAGYSEKGAHASGNRLLRNADICSRVAHLRSIKEQQHAQTVTAVIEEAGMDKAWVLKRLGKIVDLGMALEPVKDDEGREIGEIKAANLPAANTALNLIGKELGMFIDRKEVRTGPLDGLPPDEAKALIDTIDAIQRARATAPLA